MQRPEGEHEQHTADQEPPLSRHDGKSRGRQPQPCCFLCLDDEARSTAERQEADGRKCPYCNATPMGLFLPEASRSIVGPLPTKLLELREQIRKRLWPDQAVACWKEACSQIADAKDTDIVMLLDRLGLCFAGPVDAVRVARTWDVVDEALGLMPASAS